MLGRRFRASSRNMPRSAENKSTMSNQVRIDRYAARIDLCEVEQSFTMSENSPAVVLIKVTCFCLPGRQRPVDACESSAARLWIDAIGVLNS